MLTRIWERGEQRAAGEIAQSHGAISRILVHADSERHDERTIHDEAQFGMADGLRHLRDVEFHDPPILERRPVYGLHQRVVRISDIADAVFIEARVGHSPVSRRGDRQVRWDYFDLAVRPEARSRLARHWLTGTTIAMRQVRAESRGCD